MIWAGTGILPQTSAARAAGRGRKTPKRAKEGQAGPSGPRRKKSQEGKRVKKEGEPRRAVEGPGGPSKKGQEGPRREGQEGPRSEGPRRAKKDQKRSKGNRPPPLFSEQIRRANGHHHKQHDERRPVQLLSLRRMGAATRRFVPSGSPSGNNCVLPRIARACPQAARMLNCSWENNVLPMPQLTVECVAFLQGVLIWPCSGGMHGCQIHIHFNI